MNIDESGAIRLSVMRALWGEIFPQTRAVCCRIDGPRSFTIEFYVDGAITSEIADSASCVEAEVVSDFEHDVRIGHEVIRLDSPGKIPTTNRLLVFLRKEI